MSEKFHDASPGKDEGAEGMAIANVELGTVYRRSNGEVYMRLSERYHCKADNTGYHDWVGVGDIEKFDPSERVKLLEQDSDVR